MNHLKRLLLLGPVYFSAAVYPGLAVAAAEVERHSGVVPGTTSTQIGPHGIWAAAIAIILAAAGGWIAARRLARRQARRIHQTALLWHQGDLSARITVADPRSPMGTIGQLLNVLAGEFQRQLNESQIQAESLQQRLSARISDLSEAQNRLQVEIAERAKADSGVQRAHKMQVVGQLASGIAHDFNNMLATVLGSLELMERRVAHSATEWSEADATRLQTLIERAIAAVQRGAALTSQLLAFARRQQLPARATDVNRLITGLVALATGAISRRVRIVTELAADAPPAMVDPSEIEAALLNLCLNGRDAMPGGGQLTIATSHVTLSEPQDDLPPGSYIRVSVKDTGTGMPPAVLERAREPFFTTKGADGSGLGLSQVEGVVRRHGGAMQISSTPGLGTEVVLLLPRARADAGDIPATPAEPAPVRTAPKRLVLTVDDDDAVRQVTTEMLRDLGCEVVQAASGDEAVELFTRLDRKPDLAVLDYAMPGINGLQLASALRNLGMEAPVILATGYADLATTEGGTGLLGGILRKPFTIRELQNMIERVCRNGMAGANVIPLHATHPRMI
jgi:signal transduction histidine kinase/CheY-like chemotaxis protein